MIVCLWDKFSLMHDFSKKLVIDYANGKCLTATKHLFGEQEVFRISFSHHRPPLLITLILRQDKNDYWTSIPKGRNAEAEVIGKLLQPYL